MKNIRTDLAVECLTEGISVPGVRREEKRWDSLSLIRVTVETPAAAEALQKPMGRYTTIETTPFHRFAADSNQRAVLIGQELQQLLPQGDILAVGLGNAAITPDALGPRTVERILVTRHLKQEVAVFRQLRATAAVAPGVLGQTGVETAEIISAIVREIEPAAVIVIDALASCQAARLGATVQLSDTGIVPGSGVANHRKELTRRTLGIPVIAVGVPTVVGLKSIAGERQGQPSVETSSVGEMMVTPREIDTIIDNAARTVALGINRALHPMLSTEELLALVG